MQFYRDGYRPGDPDLKPASPQAKARTADIPDEVDVLIVGTGPAGAVLAAQLAAFPGIGTRVIERRAAPLELGHADGVACRTVETLQTFGLADALLREAYWVNEVRFWGPSPEDRDRITRTGWVQDTPDGLSEFPHVIVNQARMQQYLLDHAAKSASRLEVDYGVELSDLTVGEGDHPVLVTLHHTAGEHQGEERVVRARYVVGCDGARSNVRRAIGRELVGDAANHAWGVMDVLATTDFPDWRTKNVIQSAGKGSLLMIPREGGSMVRCYVDLGEVPAGDSAIRQTTAEQLTEIANSILHPYKIDVRSVAWSSVYEVGQRLTDRFDDVPDDLVGLRRPHVFIAGDACHTHSAKAGQGMNVSIQDAFNLGWKLAAVLEGRSPESLLDTYSEERQSVARDLIEFDKFWSAFIAQPTTDPEHPELGGVTPDEMQTEYARQGRYTAGLATRYRPSSLTGDGAHQALATGFEIGTRFHSARAVRVADARGMHLGHAHTADGRWRLYAFGDRTGEQLLALAAWLTDSPDSPVHRFQRDDADLDSVFDVHAILRSGHHDVDITSLPQMLLPRSGPFGLQDWEKVWAVDPADDVFAARGIGDDGALVIVRPDQYVAHVLPLTARAELSAVFEPVLLEQAPIALS
ncbi:FAD-dependent monooxygenase [Demequina capsici]|uniref:FAD-dependent monooxygenase n=1 Tax=Demequina capsici TaxID=3075620 RepID=A0AA96FF46_9MICO|nr:MULTISPECIES: FAD-dependent monooxygenase [unclassified Demequina]WNM24411.1 FAD-dependent monooxygenase [Demequina sp. OYTSA14]WNM27245.1 FAD-dependent monooxygenase [Demequina sp. PMTSA13]